MFTTLKLPIQIIEKDFIFEYQRIQSSMVKTAYSNSDLGQIELRKILKARGLDSWFQQSAIKSGLGMREVDKSLNVKTRIFGGKKNFIRRCKNLISNDEWKKLKLFPIYSIGEAPKYGNRKFEFYENKIIFKPYKGKKIEIFLPKLHKNWLLKYKQLLILTKLKKIPVTVSLTTEYITLSFNLPEKEIYEKLIETRYAGVDMNPNYIGISIWQSGILINKKLYNLKQLTGKNISQNKLDHETKEIGHSIGKWLKEHKVKHLFIEKLKFKHGNKGLGKHFNRLTINQWKINILKQILFKYYKFFEVNAAYSSFIGNLNYNNLPDPIAASAEIARRGYEVIIVKNKKFYPNLISLKYLRNRWKEIKIPEVETWKELYSWFKNSKMMYRVPIPNIGFKNFKCLQSKVTCLY